MPVIEPNPIISEMVNDAPVQEAAAEQQIEKLDESIADLEDKRDAIAGEVCGGAAEDLETYLIATVLPIVQGNWPAVPGVLGEIYLVIGPTYGDIAWSDPGPVGDIIDWDFRQDNLVPTPPIPPAVIPGPPDPAYYIRYVYTPGDYPDMEPLRDDFSFGNDYITRPLDTGASYGLDGLIAAYGSGKSIVTANKTKVADSVDVLERYNNAS